MSKRSFKGGDVLVITLLLILSAGVVLLAALGSGERGRRAVITSAGGRVTVLSLGKPETVAIPGPLGDTVVEVSERGVHVVSSPCRNKICVKMGYASRKGQTIVCVPNSVSIRIEGGGVDGVDGVVG